MSRSILVCIHRKNSDPALVGRVLRARGCALDLRCPAHGDELPDLERYDGLVIFGGPQSANDQTEAIFAEHRLVEKALRVNLPVLGICLGAQIMARVFGGKIYQPDAGQVEVGFYPIKPSDDLSDDAHHIFPRPLMVYHWHREGIVLPKNIKLLAQGNGAFPVQAFCDGQRAYGLQFHPEVDFAMIRRWLRRDRNEDQRLHRPGAQPYWRHLADYARHHRAMRRWLNGFLDVWLKEDAA